MFCTKCGKELHEGDRFCGNCGAKVREEESATSYQDVVFNPPFKREAERRTSRISKEIEELNRDEREPNRENPVFHWNLEGFPSAEPRKTEAVDFNWDSVVERRNRVRSEEGRRTAQAPAPERPEEISGKAGGETFDETAQDAKQDAKTAKSLTKTAIPEAERPLTTEELEEELFGEQYQGLSSLKKSDSMQNTAQLEKFYTYNQKKEACQELLDKEYERLKEMKEERKPEEESLEYTWASRLFPQDENEEEAEQDGKEKREAEQRPEREERLKAEVSEPTMDFSSVREAARQRKGRKEAEDAPAGEQFPPNTSLTQAMEEETTAAEQDEKADERSTNSPEESAVQRGTADEMGEAEETDKIEKIEETDKIEEAEEPEAVDQQIDSEERNGQEGASDQTETQEMGDGQDVRDTQADTAGKSESNAAAAEEEEESADIGAIPSNGRPEEQEAEENSLPAEEKKQLRFSDVFPREKLEDKLDDDADSDGHDSTGADSDSSDTQDRETTEDEEEPKKMNIFLKIVIGLLIVLIVLEGIVLAVRFIAPDSGFSQKANQLVESVIAKLTGEEPAEDEGEADMPVNTGTYISSILDSEIEKPDTIGQIAEDVSLKYDLSKSYAFPEISDSQEFTDAVWIEDGDQSITYGKAILSAVVEFYGNWKDSNEDESLIGINKLEIGEIRTGENGYYVLCRLTFAGADGGEVVEYMTANVIISQDSMVINEVKEETL